MYCVIATTASIVLHTVSFSFNCQFHSRRVTGYHVMVSYTVGVIESIGRVCRRYGMQEIFRSGLSLSPVLSKVKVPLPVEKQSKVVYRISCSCGKVYIGETKRRLETRLKEHRDACQRGKLGKSAVAEHAWKDHHSIRWEEATVVHGHGQTPWRTATQGGPSHPHDSCRGTPQHAQGV